jgi:PAS domain S-box-containing protein
MPTDDRESLYRQLFDLAPFPDALFDDHGHCLLANRAFVHHFGRPQEGGPPQLPRLSDLFERPGGARALVEEIAARRAIRRREVRLVDSDGHLVTMLLSARQLEHQGAQAVELALADISDRKRLERAWRADHARLASVVEGLSAGLVLVDGSGVISDLNHNMTELAGLEAGQAYQAFFRRLSDFARESEATRQALEQAVLAVGDRPSIEIELQGDSSRRLGLSFFPIQDEHGSPIGWGCLVSDLGGRLQRMAWKVERLSSLIRQIRAPLAALQGNAAALRANYRQWDETMVLGFLDAINRDTGQLVSQVDGGLALTGPARRQPSLKPEAVKPDDLIVGTAGPRSGEGEAESRKGAQLLIVEAQAGGPSMLARLLEDSGYQVEGAAEGARALELLQDHLPDLVLIERQLTGRGELSLIRNVRRLSMVPILLVTSPSATGYLVEALDAGADDYVSRPFQTAEMLARIRALLRRGEAGLAPPADRFQADGLRVDFDARRAWKDDQALELTPTEFELLERMIRHRGQVLTYSQLAQHLWGRESLRSRHDLFVHVSRLRKKVEADPKSPRLIVTRWGIGYVFLPR